MRRTEAEELFIEEVREKKRAANGVHSKTGKRGFVGKMYFPFELASRKEKMAYTKAGKMEVYNMYEQIMGILEFKELDENEQRNRLQYWRLNHTQTEILKAMKISSYTFYNLVEGLGLPKRSIKKKDPTATKKTRTASVAISTAKKEKPILNFEMETLPKLEFAPLPEPTPAEPEMLNGLNIRYKGTYGADEIKKMFAKLDLILDGEQSQFKIELKLSQE